MCVSVCVRACVRVCVCVCGKGKTETDKAGVQQRDRCVGMV